MAQSKQSHRIGVFGIECAGKTTLINLLKSRGYENVYESSALVQDPKVGGVTIAQFRDSSKESQFVVRAKIITHLAERGLLGDTINTGHYSFATIDSETGKVVLEDFFNDLDRAFYTDIILVGGKPSEILRRHAPGEIAEPGKRTWLSEKQINVWLHHEEAGLIKRCREAGILLHWFEPLPGDENAEANLQEFAKLIDAIRSHSESQNAENIKGTIDRMFGPNILAESSPKQAPVFMLIDGDRAISIQDTGNLFWDLVPNGASAADFKAIFETHGRSYFAFLQAAAMYSKLSQETYSSTCAKVVSQTKLHPAFVEFLQRVTAPRTQGIVVPIVITSGNVDIWRTLVDRDIGRRVPVLGGNRTPYGERFILDDKSKRLCADHLRRMHPRSKILAFGGGEVDLAMFAGADDSFLVVNDESLRCRVHADGHFFALKHRLKKIDFRKYAGCFDDDYEKDNTQIQATTLDAIRLSLPPANFKEFTDSNVSKLFTTESVCASIAVPKLFAIGKQIGAFLAAKIVNDMELEARERSNTPVGIFGGFGISDASKVAIVPVMPAGESIAFGIWELPFFSAATFISSKDLDTASASITQIIFVADIIDSGRTIREVLDRVIGDGSEPKFCARISVVASFIHQREAESLPFEYPGVKFYALCTSVNGCARICGTDSDHCLFSVPSVD